MATIKRESSAYKWVTLLETKRCIIQFVEDKQRGRDYDKIKVIKLGVHGMTGECINIFRYEDETYIETILKTFNYQD